MTLASFMIGTTFVLGVLLALLGTVALFRKKAAGGGGSLKIAGIEVNGRSGATLILLIGAVFVISGFGWAATQRVAIKKSIEADEQRASADNQRVEAERQRMMAEVASAQVELKQQELVKADQDVRRLENAHAELSEKIKAELSPDRIQAIAPLFDVKRIWTLSPAVIAGAQRLESGDG